jgi:hypothetical protein
MWDRKKQRSKGSEAKDNITWERKVEGSWASKIYKSISRLGTSPFFRVTHLPIEGIITQEKHPQA